MKTYYFNTGVKIYDNPNILGGIDSGNGTVVIPFDCEGVPDGLNFKFACDNPQLDVYQNYFVTEIFNSKLASKFAYFL